MEYKINDQFEDIHNKIIYTIKAVNDPYYIICDVDDRYRSIKFDRFDREFKLVKLAQVKTAAKADDGKVPLQLLCPFAEEGTAKVLAFGRDKYTKITGKDASHNWKLGMDWTKVIGSIRRHLNAIMRGEDIDPDSGLPHVDHLGCEIMFLQSYMAQGIGTDDRYKYNKGDKK